MLTLLTGSDRTALSRRLHQHLAKAVEAGEMGQILLVPEQFSHEAERILLEVGGSSVSRYAEVLSLKRLADRVAASCGGAARAYLDKGGRLLNMASAAEQVSAKIKLYAAVLKRPEFLVDLVAMTEEFQSYCLEPQTLLEAAGRAQGQFAQKLQELGLLYEAYLSVTDQGAADPAGRMTRLEQQLLETDWGACRTFYIDGFSDFTGAEYRVLEALLRRSRGVFLTLATGEKESAITRPARATAKTLRLLAARWQVPVTTESVDERAARSQGVQTLLEGLFFGGTASSQDGTVTLRQFDSVEAECRAAARMVRGLLAQGARCRDISLGLCDVGHYEAPLKAAFAQAELPLYFAGETALLSKPVLLAVTAALEAAVSPMDYEDVARYLKSGLPQLSRDCLDRLDDYAYRWRIRGSQWEQPWTFHPRGYGEVMHPEDEAALSDLNRWRVEALTPLFTLRRAMRAASNTGEMVLALQDFLETVALRTRLSEEAARRAAAGQGQLAQELSQLYDILCTSMEQMYLTLGTVPRSGDGLCRLWRTLLTQYQVGTIPAGLDQVYAGALADLRQRRTRHLLVLGAADGAFPAYKGAEGLITEAERRKLLAEGISLAPSRADQMDQEMSRIAAALMAAEETISLSYAGEQPAWLFRRAASLFPDAVAPGQEEIFLDLSSLAAWNLRHGCKSQDVAGLPAVQEALSQRRAYDFTPLSPETVRGLYGRELYLSASRIDKFAGCRLSYFLSYGLKAAPRKQAKLDPSAFGTFVHAVLEETVRRVGQEGGFAVVPAKRLGEIAVEEMDRYAAARFPQQAQRAAHLFRRARTEVLDIVADLGEELRGSKFQPVSCELSFADGGELPAVTVEGESAVSKISGFVDRVDLMEEGGKTYVRVVDYKTGKKDFDFTDLLYGAGLQMLIYLFALKEGGGAYYGKDALIPAGVLYLPARKEYPLTQPLPSDEDVAALHGEERRRRGLILGWEQVLSAMEEDPEHPRYMPYQMKKGEAVGNLASSRQMALLEHHVQRMLMKITDAIASGVVRPNPVIRGQESTCRFCDFKTVCHGDLCPREDRVYAATDAKEFWEILAREEENHG